MIDADALKECIKDKPKIVFEENVLLEYSFREVLDFAIKQQLKKVLFKIDKQPTIEAVPVVHAEWLLSDEEEGIWECSVCGKMWVLYGTPKDNGMNFCPKCGARMDGKKVE